MVASEELWDESLQELQLVGGVNEMLLEVISLREFVLLLEEEEEVVIADQSETHEYVEERDSRCFDHSSSSPSFIEELEILIVLHEHILIVVLLCVSKSDLHNDLFHFRQLNVYFAFLPTQQVRP